MNKFLKAECAVLFVLVLYVYFCIYAFSLRDFIIFFFIPDLSMVGYLKSPKLGAYIYNTVHNLILPCVLFLFGIVGKETVLMTMSLILFAHIFMDRMFGYGLKYSDTFEHTHISGKKSYR